MKKIFFISGLGADKRAFNRIEEFNGYEKIFIDWEPNQKSESLQVYSQRLFSGTNISDEDILIGLSFGGLIAQEIAYLLSIKKVLLISSFRDANDLKPLLKKLLNLRFHYLIPNFRISFFSVIIRNWFNVNSSEGKNILNQMVDSTNPILMKWSMEKIRESTFIENKSTTIYNIIGNKDKMLRLWENKNTSIIDGGGHFMVYENANEVNRILKKIIERSLQP